VPIPSDDAAMLPRILPRVRRSGEARALACATGAAPFAITGARCNRCGACLRLGCAAISDVGGEALAIDAALCAGGGACASACRGRAIVPLAGQ
jgi:TPP-dependent indolepyruvate ferredoxin oxidoreductase alpha subunit